MSSMAMSPAQFLPLTPVNDTIGWLPLILSDAVFHVFPLLPFRVNTAWPSTSTISSPMSLPNMWYLNVMVSFPPRIKGGDFKTAFSPGLRGLDASMYM